ncbi:MAG: tetratricopeptide repeat protein [Oligoflexia bacterium]|nr:tetratricopeptide repeat protein [Oligoflexia bacterium]
MAVVDEQELLEVAREKFRNGQLPIAERLLQQLLLINNRLPEVYQMLGTIYYDQGKFTKAIQTFKRALEIDPTFTDASIGLSIIYNDLGKYEEGKAVFQEAQRVLAFKKTKSDPYIEEKLSLKHLELGDLYFQYQRFDEALEQYYKASSLTIRKPDAHMKIVEVYIKKNQASKAVKELRKLIDSFPGYIPARLKLGVVFYNSNKVVEALQEWEGVLSRDPLNSDAQNYLKLAQEAGVTSIL